MEHPVAKATFVKTRAIWKVYWMRADLKWRSYGPVPTVGDIKMFLELVENDKHACFLDSTCSFRFLLRQLDDMLSSNWTDLNTAIGRNGQATLSQAYF